MNDLNNVPLEDKLLLCVDCQEHFLWTAGEQRYYLSKQLSQPKRCLSCRAIRKAILVKDGNGNG